jgi:hypothetical protein
MLGEYREEERGTMSMQKFIGIGTDRTTDVFTTVLEVLESARPSVIALDEDPIGFSTLIHMRCSDELFNEKFIVDQHDILLERELGVGNSAGILYAVRQEGIPVHFVDGSFKEPLSAAGEEEGIYPFFTSVEFAAGVDVIRTPINLRKGRIPTYPDWDFEYDLIHAYQTDTTFAEMDRAIWQRNQFAARAINSILRTHREGSLAFIGERKRFRYDLFRETEGVSDLELSQYTPLAELIQVEMKTVFDAVNRERIKAG